jgi:hypothetical protein
MKLAIAVLFLTIPGAAQLPDAPKPQLDRTERVFLASESLTSVVLDPWSTKRAVACSCNHEMFLPQTMADHPALLTVYGLGKVALSTWAVEKLTEHHHTKLAHAAAAADVISTLPFVIHNFTLPTSVSTPTVSISGAVKKVR